MGSLDCVRNHVRLLAYGNVDPSLAAKEYVAYVGAPESASSTPYLSSAVASQAYHAMFENSCTFLYAYNAKKGVYFNVSQCELWGGGVLKLGLAAGVERRWQDGYISADRQLKGIFIKGQLLPARGWSLNPATFDYSTVTCKAELGCDPNLVVLPSTTPQKPSVVSDPNYDGDVPPHAYPGDGIYGITNGSGPYWTGYEINTPLVKEIEQADMLYITPGLLALAELYYAEAKTNINTYTVFTGYFIPCVAAWGRRARARARCFSSSARSHSPCTSHPPTQHTDHASRFFATGFVLLMVIWFLPETVRENKAMQAKRSMLLYLPVVLISRSSKLRSIIDAIVSADFTDGFGAGAAKRKVAPM